MPERLPTSSRRPAAVLALLFLLTLPAVTTRFYASDEVEFYAWLRSAAFDRDADFDNEYRYFYDAGVVRNDGFRRTFLDETNEAGRRRNFTPIGTALLWAPFFAVGHAAAALTGAPTDGFSQPYISAVTIGSAFYGFLALGVTHAFVRRVTGRATVATIAVWIGTPLVFYMFVAPGFSHAASAFAVSLFLWLWLTRRERWTAPGAAALGAAAALMAMVREQDAFLVVGPGVDFIRTAVRQRRQGGAVGGAGSPVAKPLGVAGAGILAGLLAYAPQLVAYLALNGHPGPASDVSRKMTWTSPHALQVLFSLEHGLFLWTPLALAGVLGLVWIAAGRGRLPHPEARWIGGLALLMVAAEVYVSGSVESWTVAGSFGQRRFVALTPLLALGLSAWVAALAVTARPQLTALATAGIVLLVWWNVGLMAQFGLHRMDRQRLTLAENARTTFIDLPREMPGLVTRYFADRESFYGRRRQP
jgi:hypothetical protein